MSDQRTAATAVLSNQATATLLRELVAHLRENRTQLREELVTFSKLAEYLEARSPRVVQPIRLGSGSEANNLRACW